MDWGQRLTSAARNDAHGALSQCGGCQTRASGQAHRIAAMRHSAPHLPAVRQARRRFQSARGRLWAAFPAGDRLRYVLVGHGNRYDFYIRRYANTLTWTYGDDRSADPVRRQIVDDLIGRLGELSASEW